jgi:hypothetical protein
MATFSFSSPIGGTLEGKRATGDVRKRIAADTMNELYIAAETACPSQI